MEYKYNLYGAQVPEFHEYDIASDTVIKKGQVVTISAGLVVLAAVAQTTAILGIAAEDHTGVTDTLNPRLNGTKIKVYDSPGAVFSCKAKIELTATSGNATTFAATGLTGSYADSDFVNGYLILTGKATTSTLTDPIGTLYKITGYTNTGRVFTAASFSGGVSAGDKMVLVPPLFFNKGNFSSDLQYIDYLTASTGTIAKIVDVDLKTRDIYWTAALHLLANKAS